MLRPVRALIAATTCFQSLSSCSLVPMKSTMLEPSGSSTQCACELTCVLTKTGKNFCCDWTNEQHCWVLQRSAKTALLLAKEWKSVPQGAPGTLDVGSVRLHVQCLGGSEFRWLNTSDHAVWLTMQLDCSVCFGT